MCARSSNAQLHQALLRVRGVEDVRYRLRASIRAVSTAAKREALVELTKETHLNTLCFGPYTQPAEVALMAEKFTLVEPPVGELTLQTTTVGCLWNPTDIFSEHRRSHKLIRRTIQSRGQLAHHLLFVLRGSVAAHEGPFDLSPRIGSKRAGSVVGDLSWVASYSSKGRGHERANNVYAEEGCAVAIISFEDLAALNREHPRLGWKLIQSFTANALTTLIVTAHEAEDKVKLSNGSAKRIAVQVTGLSDPRDSSSASQTDLRLHLHCYYQIHPEGTESTDGQRRRPPRSETLIALLR
eukprot:5592820-Pyramimonas_sp.AAC.2